MGLFGFTKAKEEKKPDEQKEGEAAESNTPSDRIRHGLNELVLQSLHEGVLIIGNEGNIQLANPAACKLIGRTHEEIIDVYFDSVVNLLDKTGNRITEARNPIWQAWRGRDFKEETRDLDIVASDSGKNTPVSIIITSNTDAACIPARTRNRLTPALRNRHADLTGVQHRTPSLLQRRGPKPPIARVAARLALLN